MRPRTDKARRCARPALAGAVPAAAGAAAIVFFPERLAWTASVVALSLSLAGAMAVLRLRRDHIAVTVRGRSMEPTYRDGDRILVRRNAKVGVGDVVLVKRPTRAGTAHSRVDGAAWMVKRVAAVAGDPVPPQVTSVAGTTVPDSHLVLLGDNPGSSFDSRYAGLFSSSQVIGTVRRPTPHPPA
ncbi:S26 family signal peptidase [Spirillospora sp. NPDC048911]|uniref:S26 family signal peptidase n=1 Tax=Spirillospora sp. NPDC048911 TaxID=3364527 RepID=UPI00371410DF